MHVTRAFVVVGGTSAHQRVEQIALPITDVTASGCDTNVRWEPPENSVMCEPARSAMDRCEAGVMIRSPVLMKYQDGMVFHAALLRRRHERAGRGGSLRGPQAGGGVRGRSEPKDSTKTSCFR